MERNYGFDNVKGILIFCVVLGHLLECMGGYLPLYRMIYLFHMPVFMFVSGFFAKGGIRSVADKIWMYGLFQTIYIFFERVAKPAETAMQYITPYWILWYLFVLIFYTALIPLYRAKSKKKRIAVTLCAFLLSFLAGFVPKIGYPLSLSRFFVFQPYFLLGFYAKEQGIPKFKKGGIAAVSAGAILSLGLAYLPGLTNRMLYGSGCYTDANGALFRVLTTISAVLWIAVFLTMQDRMKGKILFLSIVGRYTLPVYLLHGGILRLMSWGMIPAPQNIWSAMATCVLICILLGNKYIGQAVAYLSPLRYGKQKD